MGPSAHVGERGQPRRGVTRAQASCRAGDAGGARAGARESAWLGDREIRTMPVLVLGCGRVIVWKRKMRPAAGVLGPLEPRQGLTCRPGIPAEAGLSVPHPDLCSCSRTYGSLSSFSTSVSWGFFLASRSGSGSVFCTSGLLCLSARAPAHQGAMLLLSPPGAAPFFLLADVFVNLHGRPAVLLEIRQE